MGVLIIKIIIVFNLLFVCLYFFLPKKRNKPVAGSFRSLEKYLDLLKKSDLSSPYVLIGVSGAEDFVQCVFEEEHFKLGYPVTTERQRSLVDKAKSLAKAEGLLLKEEQTADKEGYYLDIDLGTGDVHAALPKIESFYRSLFSISDDAVLEIDAQV